MAKKKENKLLNLDHRVSVTINHDYGSDTISRQSHSASFSVGRVEVAFFGDKITVIQRAPSLVGADKWYPGYQSNPNKVEFDVN